MTWTKLGAEWPDEARDLSDAAYRLHVDGLCYSNRRGLDLLIPKKDVARFAEVAEPETVIRELQRVEWWEDRGDVWWIGCKFAAWQRTRDQVDAKRRVDATAQKRKRMHDAGDHSLCLPRSCPLALSANDSCNESANDSGTVSASFSERNGTEAVTESTTNNGATTVNEFGVGHCAACPAFEKLGPDGLCSSCAVDAAVSARAAS